MAYTPGQLTHHSLSSRGSSYPYSPYGAGSTYDDYSRYPYGDPSYEDDYAGYGDVSNTTCCFGSFANAFPCNV